jgi:hypothetical protein
MKVSFNPATLLTLFVLPTLYARFEKALPDA